MKKRPPPRRPDVPHRPDLPRPPHALHHRGGRRRAWVIALLLVTGVTLIAGSLVAANQDRPPVAAGGSPSADGSATPTSHADRGSKEMSYAFLEERANGDPVRWDPCADLHYEVNLKGAPTGALRVARQAADRVSRATGISFVFEGVTQRTARFTESRDFSEVEGLTIVDLPVLVSWVTAEGFRRYGNPRRYAAIGTPVAGYDDQEGWYRSAEIVVNLGADARAGFSYRGDLGPLLLHEWGHVMGLAHVGDGTQIMWSRDVASADRRPSPFLVDYGEGDLAGLAAVGIEAGCGPSVLPAA